VYGINITFIPDLSVPEALYLNSQKPSIWRELRRRHIGYESLDGKSTVVACFV